MFSLYKFWQRNMVLNRGKAKQRPSDMLLFHMKRNKKHFAIMLHKPFSHHSCSVTRTREIKAAAVILISLFSRVKDFQSTLKELKIIQTLKHLWRQKMGLFFRFILLCQDGWLDFHRTAGETHLLHRKKVLGSRDCERGRPTGCGAGKTREGKFSQRAAAVIT